MKTDKSTKILGSFSLWFSTFKQHLKLIAVLATLIIGISGAGVVQLYATDCINIDNLPLDVEQQQAPAIVMFLIDNSGSMDWEVLVQGTNQGYYKSFTDGKNYGYVFHDTSPTNNANIGAQDTIEEKIPTEWKSQWSGYNHMYYDPAVIYTPWSTYTNANMNTPESDPANTGHTLSLSGDFHKFVNAEVTTTTQDLRNANAVFVDNNDTLLPPTTPLTIIIDTEDTVNTALWPAGKNYGSVSFDPGGGPAWSHSINNTAFPYYASIGLTDKTYWYSSTATDAKSKTYTAIWNFTADVTPGNYAVWVWWVASSSNASAAQYYSSQDNGSTWNTFGSAKDQTTTGGQWVSLGNLDFTSQTKIRLKQINGTRNLKQLCVDAIKIVPTFTVPAPQDVTYTDSGNWTSDTNALAYYRPVDTFPGSYNYTNTTGTFTATWQANNLTDGQAYDVFALWPYGTSPYGTSLSVDYTTYYGTDNASTATYTADQTADQGTWVKIAGGDNGITFANHVGKVTMSFSRRRSSSAKASADAVAFMPHVVGQSITIHRAHYYIQNSNGTFLVDIDGGSIKYYKYVETGNGNGNTVDYNELTQLTLGEATAAGIVTIRSYNAERQNFANWYSYYRRRLHTAKNAVGTVISTMDGVYIGIFTINKNDTYGQFALPVGLSLTDQSGENKISYNKKTDLLAKLYAIKPDDSTPLRGALANMGSYFQGTFGKPALASTIPSYYFATNTYPYFTHDKGGSCEQSFCVLMTDGYWNDSYTGVGNADKEDDGSSDNGLNGHQIDGFDGGNFADENSNTLADVAMHYYEHDLNSELANNVPINSSDSASHQHMVTYTLSFGLQGTYNASNYPNCPNCAKATSECTTPPCTCCPYPAWPNPQSNMPTTVDDLWHAAVNGRGKYINANTPTEVVTAMNAMKLDIENRLGTAASLATSSIERQVGTTLYQGTYNTGGWYGEVKALEIYIQDGNGHKAGEVNPTPVWVASQHVPNWPDRNIFSFDGSKGIDFESANISDTQRAQLSAAYSYDSSQVVDFIRGDTSHNIAHGGDFRVRSNRLGDFVHSSPCFYDGIVYIGSNDGMLHAINASSSVPPGGNEVFCYVPAMVYDHLADLANSSYTHKYYVDGSPTVSRIDDQDILVCGLGKGGKGYFALDVTDPTHMAAADVLWESPPATDDDMGYSFSNPVIVNTKAAGKVVMFGNGYASVNQKAILYILDPLTGDVTAKLNTQPGSASGTACNGLSTPSVVDLEGDGYADYAFAGDLLGNIWKFDLRGNTKEEWKVYYNDGSNPMPLISVINSGGNAQPIQDAPEVMLDCSTSDFANSGPGLMVIFGTGRYLIGNDINHDPKKQSIYGIWDWGGIWEKRSDYATAKGKYLGALTPTRTLSNVSGKSLLEQTLNTTASSSKWVILSNNTVNWYDPLKSTGNHMGWYYDLPNGGERVIQDTMLRMGVVVVVSLIPAASACESGGSSILYQLNACTGGQPSKPQFDVDNNGLLESTDVINGVPPSGEKFDRILFKPIEISNILYVSDSQGGTSWLDVPHNVLGVQYWLMLQ